MKKLKSTYTLIALLLVISSCETPFNDYDSVRPDYARFSFIVQPTPPVTPAHNATMIVPIGQSLERELEVFTSVVRDYERMFSIDIETDIPLENLEFPTTVTIPANQARTTIVFRATDISLSTTATPAILILSVHESNTSSEIFVPDFTFNVRRSAN